MLVDGGVWMRTWVVEWWKVGTGNVVAKTFSDVGICRKSYGCCMLETLLEVDD
jgi:hypothetical protein